LLYNVCTIRDLRVHTSKRAALLRLKDSFDYIFVRLGLSRRAQGHQQDGQRRDAGKVFQFLFKNRAIVSVSGRTALKGGFSPATSRYAPRSGKVAQKKYFSASIFYSIKSPFDGPRSLIPFVLNGIEAVPTGDFSASYSTGWPENRRKGSIKQI
jgi:hypothetical protein